LQPGGWEPTTFAGREAAKVKSEPDWFGIVCENDGNKKGQLLAGLSYW
jgi:hypothetical protein